MQTIRVLLPKYRLFPLDYEDIHSCEIGDVVYVPFRKEISQGIVWETNILSSLKKLKPVISKT